MRLLIDGYNLLHASGVFGEAGDLHSSREALLSLLAARLTPRERAGTVIVFDATDAPPGLPDRHSVAGIDVRFARRYADADAMIEAILEGVRGRGLTVVSSDHRVQRAARSRGARRTDSDAWLRDLLAREDLPTETTGGASPPVGKKQEWIDAFSDPAELERIAREAASAPLPEAPHREPVPPPPEASDTGSEPPARPKKRRKRRPPMSGSSDKPSGGFGSGVFDPFPPGYGEDLLPRDGDGSDPAD